MTVCRCFNFLSNASCSSNFRSSASMRFASSSDSESDPDRGELDAIFGGSVFWRPCRVIVEDDAAFDCFVESWPSELSRVLIVRGVVSRPDEEPGSRPLPEARFETRRCSSECGLLSSCVAPLRCFSVGDFPKAPRRPCRPFKSSS